jgi:hypothetical protein
VASGLWKYFSHLTMHVASSSQGMEWKGAKALSSWDGREELDRGQHL